MKVLEISFIIDLKINFSGLYLNIFIIIPTFVILLSIKHAGDTLLVTYIQKIFGIYLSFFITIHNISVNIQDFVKDLVIFLSTQCICLQTTYKCTWMFPQMLHIRVRKFSRYLNSLCNFSFIFFWVFSKLVIPFWVTLTSTEIVDYHRKSLNVIWVGVLTQNLYILVTSM